MVRAHQESGGGRPSGPALHDRLWEVRTLKPVPAELSRPSDEFTPTARTAVVAVPAPAQWPEGPEPHRGAVVSGPLSRCRSVSSGPRTALLEWPRAPVDTRLFRVPVKSVSVHAPTRGSRTVRVQSLTLAVAGLALLAPTTTPFAAARASAGAPGALASRQEGSVRAADLRSRVRDCAPVSRGRYRTDEGTAATVPVCGTDEAVFWTADMDIDCDGRPGPRCNSGTDPLFSAATAFQQSDGRQLSAESLPYIVVPGASDVWDHRDHGVRGGSVAAVVYRDRVVYAVVGDTGPRGIIGEASYATAEALGIRPDPRGGGAPSGVTYIVFKNSRATPIESHASAGEVGDRLARQFVHAADASLGGSPLPPAWDDEDGVDGTTAVRPPGWEEDWGPSDDAGTDGTRKGTAKRGQKGEAGRKGEAGQKGKKGEVYREGG